MSGSTFQLPSAYNDIFNKNVGLATNTSGGLSYPGINTSQSANPINFGYTTPQNKISTTPTTTPAVLGAKTDGGGGGGGGGDKNGGSNPLSTFSPTDEWARANYGVGLSDLLKSNQDAARAMEEANISAANSAFDYAKGNLEAQIPSLEGQRDRAISDLDLGLSGVTSQVNSSKANAQANNDQQIRQAGSIAKSTQQQNRNVLRALGIINSSAAGELLSKPMNEFASQRAEFGRMLTQRMGDLDQFLNQKVAEAKNAKDGIIAQFTDLYGKIQSDLRFNERQRVDAIKAATASLQQNLANIQNTVFNYQNQVDLQKQQFAQGLAQIAAYNNPTLAKDYLSKFLLSNSGAGNPQTAAIYNPVDQQKKQGFLAS